MFILYYYYSVISHAGADMSEEECRIQFSDVEGLDGHKEGTKILSSKLYGQVPARYCSYHYCVQSSL